MREKAPSYGLNPDDVEWLFDKHIFVLNKAVQRAYLRQLGMQENSPKASFTTWDSSLVSIGISQLTSNLTLADDNKYQDSDGSAYHVKTEKDGNIYKVSLIRNPAELMHSS